jgi:hypothetical protein
LTISTLFEKPSFNLLYCIVFTLIQSLFTHETWAFFTPFTVALASGQYSIKQLTHMMITGRSNEVMQYIRTLPKEQMQLVRTKLIRNLEVIQQKNKKKKEEVDEGKNQNLILFQILFTLICFYVVERLLDSLFWTNTLSNFNLTELNTFSFIFDFLNARFQQREHTCHRR